MADDLPPGFTVDRAGDLPPGFTPDPPRPQTFTDRLQSVRDTLGASTTGIVEGIPIVGPLLQRGVAAVAAAPAPFMAAVGLPAGGPTRLSDLVKDKPIQDRSTIGGAYKKLQEQNRRLAEEHPVASTVGNVAGGLVSTVPVARAFPKLFGGATLPRQTFAGGTIGGVDAAIRSGGDPTSTALGAGLGAAGPTIGSILAPVGQLAGAGVRWAAERTPGVKSILAPKIVPVAGKEILDATDAGYKALGQH